MRQDQPASDPATSEFVLLCHEFPPGACGRPHFDLMIQSGPTLATWQLSHDWVEHSTQLTRRIADHRLMYLDYEGSVSDGRGKVRQIDRGTCVVETWGDAEIRCLANARRGQVRLELTRTDREQYWTLSAAGVGEP